MLRFDCNTVVRYKQLVARRDIAPVACLYSFSLVFRLFFYLSCFIVSGVGLVFVADT